MTQLNLFQYGSCDCCQYVGYFAYIGCQESLRHEHDIYLYHCVCETTKGLESIIKDLEEWYLQA